MKPPKSPQQVVLESEVRTFREMAERTKNAFYKSLWTKQADDAQKQLDKLREDKT